MSSTLNQIPLETVTKRLSEKSARERIPECVIDELFHKPERNSRSRVERELNHGDVTEEDLEAASTFVKFPQKPRELFLKMFHQVLKTVERDPMSGRVSPSLIGGSAVFPLTIISTIPDIMQHYSRCILKAEKEILLATNYWQKSRTSQILTDALRELNRRAARENRHVVVKILIDHPTKENLWNHHSILPESKWSEYGFPPSSEIENLSLEINNFHRLIFGTFHAKFMVVDRRIALISSNNIQDRANLEMMTHIEGDIVDAFYDSFIISWSLPFEPDLVCLHEKPPNKEEFHFGLENSEIFPLKRPLKEMIARARLRLLHHCESNLSNVYLHSTSDDFSEIASKALASHQESNSSTHLLLNTLNLVASTTGFDLKGPTVPPLTRRLNDSAPSAHSTRPDTTLTEEELSNLAFDFTPFIFHEKHSPVPVVLVSRPPYGKPIHKDICNPQDAAWIAAFRYAKHSIFIQSPTLNAAPAVQGIIAACRRRVFVTLWLGLGFNDSKEGTGTFQGGTNEQVVKKLYQQLRDGCDDAEQYLLVYWYTGKG